MLSSPTIARNANAIRLAVFTVAVYISALTVGLRLLYYLAYVMFAVLVTAFIWSRLNKLGLSVRREVRPPQAQVGQIVEETIEVRNSTWLRKLWLEVRDRSTLPGHHVGAVVTLRGRSSKRWRVRTRCLRRGLYRLGPTAVLTGDPFGLFQTGLLFDASAELLVLPPTIPLSSFDLPLGELPGGSRTQRRAYHVTPNAAGIREYMHGDPMNRIHWPISARAQRLMVKEFDLDPTTDIWLVLDLDEEVHVSAADDGESLLRRKEEGPTASARQSAIRNPQSAILMAPGTPQLDLGLLPLEPSTEEYAVAVTASLAAYLVSQGRSVGLLTWGQHKVIVPADRGGRQLVKILRALAVLRAEGRVPLGQILDAEGRLFGRQDTVVVVTSSLQDEWLGPVQNLLFRGIRAATVLIEPGTFGGEGNPLLLVSALSAFDIPTYLVKRDDTIDAALSEPYSGALIRNFR